jgi:hypothetical protein
LFLSFLNHHSYLGSIEPGKLADPMLLSHNFFEIPVSKIRETSSVLTVVGGKMMYDARAGAEAGI